MNKTTKPKTQRTIGKDGLAYAVDSGNLGDSCKTVTIIAAWIATKRTNGGTREVHERLSGEEIDRRMMSEWTAKQEKPKISRMGSTNARINGGRKTSKGWRKTRLRKMRKKLAFWAMEREKKPSEKSCL
jgi:hypothetical protein